MRIAINGIGIAGPTLAYWLRRFGHEPTLFEKAPALRTGGYLIDFWGLGFEIAERMGLAPAVLERGYAIDRLSMVNARGDEVAGIDVAPIRNQLHGRFVSLARADLAGILFGSCMGIPAYFGVTITDVIQDERGVVATMSDGRQDRFDLVVGADGLHSQVRRLVFGPETQVEKPLGCHVAAFRLAGYSQRDERTYVSRTVAGRHVARVGLRGGETLVLLIWRSELLDGEPTRDQQKAAVRRVFGDMRWEVPEILDRLEQADDLYFDRVSQIHLARWSSGRVALVGDAAACVSLLAGEGTGLAMLEAYVLAGELHHAGTDIDRALMKFEERLRTFVVAKQKAALGFRGFFVPRSPLGLAVRNLIVKALSVRVVAKTLIGRSLRDDFVLPDYLASAASPPLPHHSVTNGS